MPLANETRLGPYEILGVIGAGGMGEVYRARDTRLDRIVAIKVAHEKFSDRFEREAKAVAALNHPNICTLYDVGPSYLVMEFIEGNPLHGPLPLTEVVRLALQIAEALSAAHKRGIVHRDLKPGNIMVTNEGTVKILDFGLAQIDSPAFETDATRTMDLTAAGTAVGTVAYMSPEQARGQAVDARSDLWSFGVVLYELVAGARPFEGETAAVIYQALLGKTPVPVRERSPQVPAELEAIIGKALEKDREMRYQSAADLRADLKRLERTSSVSQNEAAMEKPRRNPWRRYGIAAAAMVVCAGGGLLVWQRAQARPLLTDKDVLVMADFSNSTSDPVFDGALHEALAIQLEQSPFLLIMDEQTVRQDLRLMGRQPTERITNDIAREVCIREGQKATIGGSIASLGTRYLVSLEAANCQTGVSLARIQTESADKEHVLKALSEAAGQIRQKLGESLASIQKLSRPSQQMTTPSLEALQAFYLGSEQRGRGSDLAAIPFFVHATELDPNFATAYQNLSRVYLGVGERELGDEALSKAFDLIDHVGDEERLSISADYYDIVTGDLGRAQDAYRLLANTYPRLAGPHNQLGNISADNGSFEEAAREYQEAIRLADRQVFYTNLARDYIALDEFDKAKKLMESGLARKLAEPNLRQRLLEIADITGDAAGAAQQLQWAAGKPQEYQFLGTEAANEDHSGRWARARDLRRRAAGIAGQRNLAEAAVQIEGRDALSAAEFGQCTAAKSEALSAILPDEDSSDAYRSILALAICGDGAAAEKAADDVSRRFPMHTLWKSAVLPHIYAAIELNHGHPDKAIDVLEAARPYERNFSTTAYLRGLAYLDLHKGPEGAAEFRKILDHKGVNWGVLYPLAQAGFARATALSGDTAAAKKAYQDFFTLWKDADPDLPPLVQARKEFAALR